MATYDVKPLRLRSPTVQRGTAFLFDRFRGGSDDIDDQRSTRALCARTDFATGYIRVELRPLGH
jgi:hypothetical protein